jgi:hypothetical protein
MIPLAWTSFFVSFESTGNPTIPLESFWAFPAFQTLADVSKTKECHSSGIALRKLRSRRGLNHWLLQGTLLLAHYLRII